MADNEESGEGASSKPGALFDWEVLAKVLPIRAIYDDLFSKAFKQFGEKFEDFAKSVRRACPNLQINAVEQDRLRKLIEEPFFRVPSERRTLPPSQLIGQILEGARYEPEGSELWEMFQALLQRGYDKSREEEAHPSFAGIIRQLSPDEALLLRDLQRYERRLVYKYKKVGGEEERHASWDELAEEFSYVAFPKNMYFYVQHLEALGLLNMLVVRSGDVFLEGEHSGWFATYFVLQLNVFGEFFCKACLDNPESVV